MTNKKNILIFAAIILNLIVLSSAASAQNFDSHIDLNGKLEVLHADDFQHPENSKYIFYLNVDGKRYELQSGKQLPVVLSGTLANVKGKIDGNKIIVDSLAIQQTVNNAAPALSVQEQQVLNENPKENKNILSGLKLSWHYGIIPLIGILAFLAYVETKRKIDHARLLVKHRDNKAELLRNYIQNYLKKGYSKEQIRNALVKYSYAPNDIEEAFKEIK